MTGLAVAASWILCLLALVAPGTALGGEQDHEPLAASVRTALHRDISDHGVPNVAFDTEADARRWLGAMSRRLARRIPDRIVRNEFLVTVHYEAKRAGLDPQLVLALIQVESDFRKYAVSSAGARGFMQVMPFWVKLIGESHHNLFHLRINLRYGCVILRYYLDRENGDLYRALGRYNGSLGKPDYPYRVVRTWQRNWNFPAGTSAGREAERGRAAAPAGG